MSFLTPAQSFSNRAALQRVLCGCLGHQALSALSWNRIFHLHTDNRSLLWLDKMKDTKSKLSRWSLLLHHWTHSRPTKLAPQCSIQIPRGRRNSRPGNRLGKIVFPCCKGGTQDLRLTDHTKYSPGHCSTKYAMLSKMKLRSTGYEGDYNESTPYLRFTALLVTAPSWEVSEKTLTVCVSPTLKIPTYGFC